MSGEAVRVGVIGVGALGRHHARVYSALTAARLVGVHDLDPSRAAATAAEHGGRSFPHVGELLAEVDAVSIAVPTVDHHRVARAALEAGRDVLLEKPMTATLGEADDLIGLAEARGAVLQVGHVERFNPALDVLRSTVTEPRFIEVHRLGSFSQRSLDIDVVLDLMIHDLDIVLSLDRTPTLQVDAVGIPVLTGKVDIANARLRFASGLIANLTASRVSAERTRKFRVFAPNTYISMDLAAREAHVYRLVSRADGSPEISVARTAAPNEEPLRRQLAAFIRVVQSRGLPPVPAADGRRALALAHEILNCIQGGDRNT